MSLQLPHGFKFDREEANSRGSEALSTPLADQRNPISAGIANADDMDVCGSI
jgi:hypothetical protein